MTMLEPPNSDPTVPNLWGEWGCEDCRQCSSRLVDAGVLFLYNEMDPDFISRVLGVDYLQGLSFAIDQNGGLPIIEYNYEFYSCSGFLTIFGGEN